MREVLFSKIDLATSKMKPYQGFIFLCGGPTDVKSFHPVSIRDAIQRELCSHADIEARIRIAEDYKNWATDGIYRDLVSFESHLAELSSVIVLILESAGAIAELGLFSAIDEFKQKLLVFIETEYYKSSSFIKLGPVDYLEKFHLNIAECHRWNKLDGRHVVFDSAAAKDLQPELAEAIRIRASAPTVERQFDQERWLDVALLACDLLGLCSALTVRELRQLLVGLGCERTETDVKQLLFILESVKLIAMEPKGDQRFYIGIDEREHIQFSLKDKNFDSMRFRADLLQQYEREDKKRFRAIKDVRSR